MSFNSALQAMHEAASALSFSQQNKLGPKSPPTSTRSSAPENGKSVWWQSDGVARKRASFSGAPDDADLRPFGSDIENESPNAAGTPIGGASTIKAGFLWQHPHSQSGVGSSDSHQQHHLPPFPGSTPSISQSQQHSRLLHWKSGWSAQSSGRSRPHAPADAWKRAQRLLKLGESLAIIRPVLYVALLRRYGSKSWVPWTVALMCEGLSHTLTTIATRQLRKV